MNKLKSYLEIGFITVNKNLIKIINIYEKFFNCVDAVHG